MVGHDTPPRALTRSSLRLGAQVLGQREPQLAAVVRRLGVPPLWGRRPGFATLVRIILEQQVSLAAARTMFRRLHAHARGVSPGSLEALGVRGLREFGLTRQKATYCHGLAARVLDGSLDLAQVARGGDESGRALLLDIPGLGPWSVDIYYLMALRRPDIWPQGDLALAIGMREVMSLRKVPTREQQLSIASRWAPWRSVAARILWAHYLQR
jgi:DNA-3-methyladenine glycosylase II